MKPFVLPMVWMRTFIIYIEAANDTTQRGELALTPRDGSGDSSITDQDTPPFWTWFIENPRGRGV
jgi:hypothetical protein